MRPPGATSLATSSSVDLRRGLSNCRLPDARNGTVLRSEPFRKYLPALPPLGSKSRIRYLPVRNGANIGAAASTGTWRAEPLILASLRDFLLVREPVEHRRS